MDETLSAVRRESIAFHVQAAQSADEAGEPGVAARHRQIAEAMQREHRESQVPPMYGARAVQPDDQGQSGLWASIRAEGFDLERKPRVSVRFRAFGFVGAGDITDISPQRVDSPALGFDQRYLWPTLPTMEVGADITSVPGFRQQSRTMASPTDMVRDIDDVTTKPETSSAFEIAGLPLSQIASVQTGIPNVLFRNGLIRDVIETDLRFAFLDAVDAMILQAISDASPPNGTTGGDLLAQIRNGIAAIEDARYNPDTVALSPTDAASLDLLQTAGPEGFYLFAAANVAPGVLFRRVRVRTVKNLDDPLVLDSQSAGRMYITTVDVSAFEENAGQTNSQTARYEANGAFAVQRTDAIYRIGS